MSRFKSKTLARLQKQLNSDDGRVRARARWVLNHPDRQVASSNRYHYGYADVPDIDKRPTILYKATNVVNGKIYIGITSKTLKARINGHFASANEGAPYPMARAIRKYGQEQFSFSTLAIFPNYKFAQQMEIAAIAAFKPDYNVTLGGEGALGFKHTPETIAKMSAAKTGKPSRLPWVGKKRDPETIAKMSAAKRAKPTRYWLGKKRSEETIEKIKQTKKGCKPPPLTELMAVTRAENCRKAAANRRKKVICLTDGQTFESAREASDFYGFSPTAVAQVCGGKKRKSCCGKEFRYV